MGWRAFVAAAVAALTACSAPQAGVTPLGDGRYRADAAASDPGAAMAAAEAAARASCAAAGGAPRVLARDARFVGGIETGVVTGTAGAVAAGAAGSGVIRTARDAFRASLTFTCD
jgi:hypothetical protein